MDYFQRYIAQFRHRLLALFIINDFLIIGGYFLIYHTVNVDNQILGVVLALALVFLLIIFSWLSTAYLVKPTKFIWQVVLHISPTTKEVSAPKLENAPFGREMLRTLNDQIYQIATSAASVDKLKQAESHDLHKDLVVASLPLPLFVLDKDCQIIFANTAAQHYINSPEDNVIGKNFYTIINMSFDSSQTLGEWLDEVSKKSAVASKSWDRVSLKLNDGETTKMFDLAAYYNKSNPQGYETILMLFDHTEKYSEDQNELSFVAMAVHELRTPLTLLRGYIEALEENTDNSFSDDGKTLLLRMEAASHQLTTFINNVLNLTRIEEGQLVIKLHEESWQKILLSTLEDMRLQANVRGIELEAHIADNLPTVGADRVSLYEVVSNLVGNAIKYSGNGKRIIIDCHLTKDGLVETTVQDFGVGIPESVVPKLFEKFYRSHRSRTQVSGTGLGLYISKVIVNAHSGNIWVRSKEGQGTIFGFTIMPYTMLAPGQQQAPEELTRVAHGWIKNHSLYRR